MTSLGRILLVEDNPRDAELALDALASHNLANRVTHLRDGAEALDYLFRRGQFTDRTSAQPMLVLLDLKMPKVDGIEVLRAVRADAELKTLPIVVMTSSKEEADLTACYALGANAYVVKPVNFHDFVETVRSVGQFWAVINEPPPQLDGE